MLAYLAFLPVTARADKVISSKLYAGDNSHLPLFGLPYGLPSRFSNDPAQLFYNSSILSSKFLAIIGVFTTTQH